jgi:hypothetical protein
VRSRAARAPRIRIMPAPAKIEQETLGNYSGANSPTAATHRLRNRRASFY